MKIFNNLLIAICIAISFKNNFHYCQACLQILCCCDCCDYCCGKTKEEEQKNDNKK